jgi:hypothetical protein
MSYYNDEPAEITEHDREKLAHLMAVGQALKHHAPQSVIDWNRAITKEVTERERAKLMEENRQRALKAKDKNPAGP